jgi:ubiquinone/menaquinone biosynthesis C-methylase UbiE
LIQELRQVDIGTGTGAWAVEVADQFPSAVVYGTDLSPIQPQWVPENVEFRVENITQGLDFDDGSTDLVHSR